MNISSELEQYILNHSSKESGDLKKLRKETYQKSIQPHMLSGVLQGRILSTLSKIIQPKNILEIGTFTGYSALCLVEGLATDGKLITIDNNPELEHISEKYLSTDDRIEYRYGNALDIIPTIEEGIDIIFLDADKENYTQYLSLLYPKMKTGNIILADNVLWKEKVIDHSQMDKQTQGIREFNINVAQNSNLEVVILPIRDGISVIRKT